MKNVIGFSPNQFIGLKKLSMLLQDQPEVSAAISGLMTSLDDGTRQVMERVKSRVDSGVRLSDAFRQEEQPWCHPLVIGIVRSGEIQGDLFQAFVNLIEYINWRTEISPGVDESIKEQAVWFRTLGMCMSVGMPILQALDLATGEVSNPSLREAAAKVDERIRTTGPGILNVAGDYFADWVKLLFLYGEETGSLEMMCQLIADILIHEPFFKKRDSILQEVFKKQD